MNELLRVDHLQKFFPVATRGNKKLNSAQRKHWLHAVDDISFNIASGESVGLVGESGCGKSTLSRLIARLVDFDEGRIGFDGHDVGQVSPNSFPRHPMRGAIQMVFQDSNTSLNPRFTAFAAIAEPLQQLLGIRTKSTLWEKANELAKDVGLATELLTRYPHQLSGGQRARVNIARALASHPKLLILDEPTSALDVSVQAVILKLLAELRTRFNMSYLFVSHDLNLVRLLCDRVLVMYLGKIIEAGTVDEVFTTPRHPYTKGLLNALPRPNQAPNNDINIGDELSSPIDPPSNVCRFYSRCPNAQQRCKEQMPELLSSSATHRVACHFPLDRSFIPKEQTLFPEQAHKMHARDLS